MNHNKLWKILKQMGIPDHRNLYAGQEATVRTRHGTTDWFQIGKGVHQVYILSPFLFMSEFFKGRSKSFQSVRDEIYWNNTVKFVSA